VKLLADKGLVAAKPRAGAVVRPRSEWRRLDTDVLLWQIGEPSDAGFVDNLFEVRRIIEPDAAAIVARRANRTTIAAMEEAVAAMAAHEPQAAESLGADLAFHRHLLTGTDNDFISGFVRLLDPLLRALFRIQRAAKPRSEVFVADHRAVLDAIHRGDAEGARATAAALLTCAERDAMDGIRLLAPSAGSATARSIS
jgi:DNA-binding FadR family transcriptional regulator